MGMVHGDRVLETTTTTGTGTITLAGAISGYQTMAAIATVNGDMFPYVIAGAAEWEAGIGTRLSSTTFSRSPTASSNAGALVNFSAGTKEVWIDASSAFLDSMRARNLVINGGMEVSQEFGGAVQTGAVIGTKNLVDMFQLVIANTGAAFTTQQRIETVMPDKIYRGFKISTTTADAAVAAADRVYVYSWVEGYRAAQLLFGSSQATSVAVGFWVRAFRAGIYTFSISNSAGNRFYCIEYTINASDTWEYKTVVIPGDVTGTWEVTNAAGIYLYWHLMAGSAFQGTANAWGTSAASTANQVNAVQSTSDTFFLTGVSLVPGSVPVPQSMAPYSFKPFDEELALCQRYCTRIDGNNGYSLGTCIAFSTSAVWACSIPFPVPMRAAPTITVSGATHFAVGGTGFSGATTAVSFLGMINQASLNTASVAGTPLTLNNAYSFQWNTVGPYLLANARL